ncbi:MAG: DUF4845 domain-containing protein, partial [Pseudohongiellaceae bacterium]
IGFFTLLGLKIIPVYMNALTVSSVLSGMEDEPGMGSKSPAEILSTLDKRLSINMIKDIGRDEIYLDSGKDVIILELEYEVRRSFIGNIDLVMHFNQRADIRRD